MFGLENMVTLIIGSGKADLGGKGREPLKRGDRLCWILSGGKGLSWERSEGLVGDKAGNQNGKKNPGNNRDYYRHAVSGPQGC